MKRAPYMKVVGGFLESVGFRKMEPVGEMRLRPGEAEWERHCGEYKDQILMSCASFEPLRSITAFTTNTVTNAVINKARLEPPDNRAYIQLSLMKPDNSGDWWPAADPDGPRQMIECLETVMLPRLEALHSLEGVKTCLLGGELRFMNAFDRMNLSVVLARLGEKDAAMDILNTPPPKWWEKHCPHWRVELEALRDVVLDLKPEPRSV